MIQGAGPGWGRILVTASAIAWSTAGYFTTLIPLDNWTLLFWRGWFGALGIFAFMAAIRGAATLTDLWRLGAAGWLFAIVSAIGMVCFITALTRTSVAHVAIIYGLAPFLAAGLGWLILGARPGSRAMLAALVALAGVMVMVGGMEAGGDLIGDVLALGMTFTLALMMVIAKRHPEIPFLAAAGLSVILTSLVAWPFVAPSPTDGIVWMQLAAFGLVNSALGLALFMLGARLLPPIETALIGALDAPLAPIWVWLAFGIVPDKATFLGGFLVFGAVAAHLLAERAPKAV